MTQPPRAPGSSAALGFTAAVIAAVNALAAAALTGWHGIRFTAGVGFAPMPRPVAAGVLVMTALFIAAMTRRAGRRPT